MPQTNDAIRTRNEIVVINPEPNAQLIGKSTIGGFGCLFVAVICLVSAVFFTGSAIVVGLAERPASLDGMPVEVLEHATEIRETRNKWVLAANGPSLRVELPGRSSVKGKYKIKSAEVRINGVLTDQWTAGGGDWDRIIFVNNQLTDVEHFTPILDIKPAAITALPATETNKAIPLVVVAHLEYPTVGIQNIGSNTFVNATDDVQHQSHVYVLSTADMDRLVKHQTYSRKGVDVSVVVAFAIATTVAAVICIVLGIAQLSGDFTFLRRLFSRLHHINNFLAAKKNLRK